MFMISSEENNVEDNYNHKISQFVTPGTQSILSFMFTQKDVCVVLKWMPNSLFFW